MRCILVGAISGILVALCVTGCSGTLKISDEAGHPLTGVPVATYELWIEEGIYTRLSKGGPCDGTTPFQKITSIATGPKYYVMVKGSGLAKTTFDVKLNSDGALTELSFNSESNVPDTLNALANVLKTAPALGIAAAGAPAPGPLPACDSGEVIKKLTKYRDWMQAH